MLAMNSSKPISFIAACLLTFCSVAGGIDKGYEALSNYDYFKAKKYFSKALKYNESAGAQGLALIYYRTDNPFHSYDSAYVFINRSIQNFDMVKERKKERYAALGFTKDSLYSLRQLISNEFYAAAMTKPTVNSLTEFIDKHPWATQQAKAISTRDSLAFFNAVQVNTSDSYKSFMETYPESRFITIAKDNFYDVQFLELTETGTLESFEKFIEANPNSPLRAEAELKVFEGATSPNDPISFKKFIQKYTENRFVDSAWQSWYQLELMDYSKDVMHYFIDSTNSPFKADIEQDLKRFDSIFLPFSQANSFGYMNYNGGVVIPKAYDFASFFQEGMAAVVKDGKYGFIDKRGALQIPCMFESAGDFKEGYAIVEMNERFGMIDRVGNFVFECMFDDLGILSEGLSYGLVADRYGYYNLKGEMVIPHEFDDAYDFKNGEAKVEKDGMLGIINAKGQFIVPAVHEAFQAYHDTMFVFSDDGLYGLMNLNSQIFVAPVYSSINPMNEGFAVAVVDDRLVYLDSAGTVVIDNGFSTFPNYQSKAEFEDGIAIVYKNGKYGRINLNGKFINEPKFENIGGGTSFFSVAKDGLWGVCNAAGKTVVLPEYDALYATPNGKFIANLDDTLGVISPTGSIIVPIEFTEVEFISGDLYLVKQGAKSGVYKNEELIVPVRYEQIGMFSEDFLFLNSNGNLNYYDLKRQQMVEVKE